jgi:hypothetical protein
MTLLEVTVATAMGVTVAAAATVSIADQVKRARAVDAAKAALQPHTVARDRALALRSCVETVGVPPLGASFTPPSDGISDGGTCTSSTPCVTFPSDAQRNTPRVAVIEWSSCEDDAFMSAVTFFDLDGDITVTPYDSEDGRAVFGPEGGLTTERPRGSVATIVTPCGPPPQFGGGVALADAGRGDPGATSCKPPSPPGAPPDISFTATTYFGAAEAYRIAARAGATQGSSSEQAQSPF